MWFALDLTLFQPILWRKLVCNLLELRQGAEGLLAGEVLSWEATAGNGDGAVVVAEADVVAVEAGELRWGEVGCGNAGDGGVGICAAGGCG